MAYHALILAGGGGTRLWPLSRRRQPKQALPLIDCKTMFQVSVERLAPLFTPEQIFVVTGEDQVDILRCQTPAIPTENFIVEPARRDTGPAAALGIMHIARHDPDAVVAVLTSDHHIGNPARFRAELDAARKVAEHGYIVTLSIAPSFPSSGYAYLRRGRQMAEIDGFPCYQVTAIHEKPELEVATAFLLAGNYSWNSGMLIGRARLALNAFRRRIPTLGDIFDNVAPSIGTPHYQDTLRAWFPKAPSISIDQAIMKDANNLVTLMADIGWSDVGSWTTLYDVLRADEFDNVMENAPRTIQLRTRGTFVISERMVVTIGLEDMVIVDTDDVLLICRRDQSEEVRQIVQMLKEWGLEEYL